MCHFDFAENCIFGFFTGDFQSHEKTKILFSSNVPVSRFLAHKGPTAALCWVWQVVIASRISPGSGPAMGLSEGGHLEGQRVLPGAFALYRGGRTQSTKKSWLQKSARHLCQLELSASFGPDDPGMFLCGDVAQDRGVKRHIRRFARTWRPKALGDGFRHQFLY